MPTNSLPPPPRFGSGGGQFPRTMEEVAQFIRWLVSLWRKADNSTTDQQVISYLPQGSGDGSALAVQNALAIASAGRPILPKPIDENLAALISRRQTSQPSTTDVENVANLALMLAFRAQPVPQVNPNAQYGVGLQCFHNDRISIGTGNIVGQVLTAATGPPFSVSWIGSTIAINGSLFLISGWTSGTVITLSGAPPAGAVGWEFMLYPANQFNAGSQLIEIDRTVTYRVANSAGTCNTAGTTVTWLTGPKFSPYWQGLQIFVNGVSFTVIGATQTTLILDSSAGVLAGVTWFVANSSWFYDVGMMVGVHASIPTDLDRYSDLNFLYRDTTRLVTYIGVDDPGVGGFYFAWLEGVEFMTLAACLARTFRASDNGYEVWISDYGHLIVWSGTAFGWGPGEGSGYIIMAPGVAPQGGPWAFCDGSAANVLKIVAGAPSAVSVTTPDMRSDTFVRGGTYTGVADAATSPSTSGAGLIFTGTAVAPTGTNSVPSFTGTIATLTGAVAAPVFTGSAMGTHTHDSPVGSVSATIGFVTSAFGTGTLRARSVDFTTSSSAGNANVMLTGATSAGTPAGTNSAPTLTMNPYTPAGTVSAPTIFMNNYTPVGTISGSGTVGPPTVGSGAPKSMALLFYMRQ